MKIRILSALIAMGVAGSALAQAVPPPPTDGEPRPQLSMRVPPLPPGCVARDRQAPPPPPPGEMAGSQDGLTKTLGLNGTQATRVQQVFAHQAAQALQLDQQRRALDAETCRSLRTIVGDQEMTRWAATMPPPPPAGGPERGPNRGPDRGPAGTPPPPQGK
jgi:hypothetical protein